MSQDVKSAKTAATQSVSSSKNRFEISLNEYFLLRWGLYKTGIKPNSDNDFRKLMLFTKMGLMEKHENGSFHTKQSLVSELDKIKAFLARPKEFKNE